MQWLEQKYVGLLSSRLRNYKRKSSGLINFSCPICGDSTTDTRKARAYIFEKKGRLRMHCHNCGVHMMVVSFIKTIDLNLYNEYVLEKLKETRTPEQQEYDAFVEKMKVPKYLKDTPLKGLRKISQLKHDHPCKEYVVARKIPNPYHAKLFYCPKFKTFTNEWVPGKFENTEYDEDRLLIPFIDRNKDLHAYQGRTIGGDSKVKYITIILDDTVPKVYGLDTCEFTRKYYVFEGPIDSMFVPNSIAAAGGDLVSSLATFDREKAVIVYDNEPRSNETVHKIEKAINNGFNVCIWPENMEHKDINKMVMVGLSPEFIKWIIDQNTYRNLAAKLALTRWKKT